MSPHSAPNPEPRDILASRRRFPRAPGLNWPADDGRACRLVVRSVREGTTTVARHAKFDLAACVQGVITAGTTFFNTFNSPRSGKALNVATRSEVVNHPHVRMRAHAPHGEVTAIGSGYSKGCAGLRLVPYRLRIAAQVDVQQRGAARSPGTNTLLESGAQSRESRLT